MPNDVRVELDLRKSINYAMQQNDVPVILDCRAVNGSPHAVQDAVLCLSSEPEFAEPVELRVDRLDPGSTYRFPKVDFTLRPGFLRNLEERVKGLIRVVLRAGEQELFRGTEPVSVLAYDEWNGLGVLPELLAAFVMPNHPAVEKILSAAAQLLRESARVLSLSGYQTGKPEHVLMMTEAIYRAIQGLQIGYVNPPASFEERGQKIRTPGRLAESRLGTCLDLTVLAAACLEQAGLRPVICITQGHAFPGVWLKEQCFPEAASDDALRLRKLVEAEEICVFESTSVTTGSPEDFARAREHARRHLRDGAAFRCVVDVTRARSAKIRPLPTGARRESGYDASDAGHAPLEGTALSTYPAAVEKAAPETEEVALAPTPPPAEPEETPESRLDRWKRNLLDLSLRNRLLNFGETRKTVRLLIPDLVRLFEALEQGQPLTVGTPPPELVDPGPRDYQLHQAREGEDIRSAVLDRLLQERRLTAAVQSAQDLQRRLVELFREARMSIEEGGANTLFLAAGFLAWYEAQDSGERRLAPIVLVPLQISRKSVHGQIEVQQAGEEPAVNVTLLEKLRHDFGMEISGLDNAANGGNGLDISHVLRAFRRAVKDIDRWEVVEDAVIGLFSFQKFLMWKDLEDRADEVRTNELVAHLIDTPTLPYRDQGEFPDEDSLDDRCSPADVLCPLDADGSQLAAVLAAQEGKTFVLQGPPGTGKSQTIANIIADSLARGKTVLFVSEKMAALEVVHRRLAQAGLADFCLELHSAKSNKRQVLDSLEASLRASGQQTAGGWRATAEKLAESRRELNAYVRALHKRRDCGLSLFQGIGELVRLREVPRVRLPWDEKREITPDALEKLSNATQDLQAAAGEADPPQSSAWRGVRATQWTPRWEDSVFDGIRELQDRIRRMRDAAAAAGPLLGIQGADGSEKDLRAVNSVAKCLLDNTAMPSALLTAQGWRELDHDIRQWVSDGRMRDSLREQLFSRYRPDILDLDLDRLRDSLTSAESSWWPARSFGVWRVACALRQKLLSKERLDISRLRQDLEAAITLRAKEESLSRASGRAREVFGGLWRDGEAEWERLEKLRAAAAGLRRLATLVAGRDGEKDEGLRQQWAAVLCGLSDEQDGDDEVRRTLEDYVQAAEAFAQCRKTLSQLLALEDEEAWGKDTEPGCLSRAEQRLQRWTSNRNRLRPWCRWQASRDGVVKLQLEALVEKYEDGSIPADKLADAFRHSFFHWWVSRCLDREPLLRAFSRDSFEASIERFRNLDGELLELTRGEIKARLAARVPASGRDAPETSEVGILMREVGKKTRHRPIRRLLKDIPHLLPLLKPCLLMSPLSVAQYLDLSLPPRDLVIFDEASQIPVWDAVGAISRGRQAVIVGDSKQLPPTTFFMRLQNSDDDTLADIDLVEDLESILDECVAARVRQLYLRWHYRSRHESLIAFSNRNYYENRLLIFPSPHREIGVRFHYVDGVYARGQSNTNRKEAEAVVEEIVRRLTNPARASESIGVVTFNIQQQRLIEDLLDDARRDHPDIEQYFDRAEEEEALFVKNLETVQGDERDVIILSVCYGPDESGFVSMNFGPLNHQGGERRLNVAVTRARKELLVFSSLRADQIDLSRTNAVGARHLKEYLDFAERGEAALRDAAAADPAAKCESFLEEDVCRALVERGHTVHPQVGVAGYRIDLAIVHPDRPGRYVLGVECDGAQYHSAKTARDRDRLREMVLRDLGWRLHRIWSSDWWLDREREIERLEEAIRKAIEEYGSQGTGTPAPAVQHGREGSGSGLPQPETPPADPPASVSPRPPAYTPVKPRRRRSYAGDIQFVPGEQIRQVLEQVVNTEGPVSLELASRRVAAHWGIRRLTTKVAQRIAHIARSSLVRIEQRGNRTFLWPADSDPACYQGYRVPDSDPESRRESADLPPEEVANAASELLRRWVSLPLKDLTTETARVFGFQRTGKGVALYIQEGIDLLVSRGEAALRDGQVTLRPDTGPTD